MTTCRCGGNCYRVIAVALDRDDADELVRCASCGAYQHPEKVFINPAKEEEHKIVEQYVRDAAWTKS